MISVVIPTYKEPDALNICLKSATENKKINTTEIIVVCDGYYELNKSVLDLYKDDIRIIKLEENYGLSTATNVGVQACTNEYVLIVNDDNVFPNDWDLLLTDEYYIIMLENNIIVPNQIECNPSIFHKFEIKNFGNINNFKYDEFLSYGIQCNIEKFREWDRCGYTLPIYIKKINYLKVGGWDEHYPGPWVVDLDFFYKLSLCGIESIRIYGVVFYHFGGIGTSQLQKSNLELKALEFFKDKWGGYPKRNKNNFKVYI
ncbi:MAG TPA: glycosyltransferase family 2 protein [Thermotogota bacterium]|nr:glycosyltransferase family 2 protein [Thermotogota bacterium]